MRFLLPALLLLTAGCSQPAPEPGIITVAIPVSPNNLDPRYGTDENSARAQRSGHVPHDSRVLARLCKVAKAREEIEDAVVRMPTERHAHVVLSEPKAPVRAFAGFPDAAGSQVQPGDVETLGRQVG